MDYGFGNLRDSLHFSRAALCCRVTAAFFSFMGFPLSTPPRRGQFLAGQNLLFFIRRVDVVTAGDPPPPRRFSSTVFSSSSYPCLFARIALSSVPTPNAVLPTSCHHSRPTTEFQLCASQHLVPFRVSGSLNGLTATCWWASWLIFFSGGGYCGGQFRSFCKPNVCPDLCPRFCPFPAPAGVIRAGPSYDVLRGFFDRPGFLRRFAPPFFFERYPQTVKRSYLSCRRRP